MYHICYRHEPLYLKQQVLLLIWLIWLCGMFKTVKITVTRSNSYRTNTISNMKRAILSGLVLWSFCFLIFPHFSQ